MKKPIPPQPKPITTTIDPIGKYFHLAFDIFCLLTALFALIVALKVLLW